MSDYCIQCSGYESQVRQLQQQLAAVQEELRLAQHGSEQFKMRCIQLQNQLAQYETDDSYHPVVAQLQAQLAEKERQLSEMRCAARGDTMAGALMSKDAQIARAEIALVEKERQLVEAEAENHRLSEASQSIVALLHTEKAEQAKRIEELEQHYANMDAMIARRDKREEALEAALGSLVAKWKLIKPKINAMCVLETIHGRPYSGPTIGVEFEVAEQLLSSVQPEAPTEEA